MNENIGYTSTVEKLSDVHEYLLNKDGTYGKPNQRLGQRLKTNTDRIERNLNFAIERIGKLEDRQVRTTMYFGKDLITFLYIALVVQMIAMFIVGVIYVVGRYA